jgi:hypothetical protein
MAGDENWVDVGAVEVLAMPPLQRVTVEKREIAISFRGNSVPLQMPAITSGARSATVVLTASILSVRGIIGSSIAAREWGSPASRRIAFPVIQ